MQQMLDERINMELDVIDASRDAKEAIAQEASRQKSAERRLEQLARQRAEIDAELSKTNKTLVKEKVIACRAALSCSTSDSANDGVVCLSGARTASSR